MLPLQVPKQETFVKLSKLKANIAGWLILTCWVIVQLFASVIVTMGVEAGRLWKLLAVWLPVPILKR